MGQIRRPFRTTYGRTALPRPMKVLFDRLNDYGKSKVVGKYIVPLCTTPDAMGQEAQDIVHGLTQDILSA